MRRTTDGPGQSGRDGSGSEADVPGNAGRAARDGGERDGSTGERGDDGPTSDADGPDDGGPDADRPDDGGPVDRPGAAAGGHAAARREPVGAPVVRGDPELTGAHAEQAARFDPRDSESVAEATEVARSFAAGDVPAPDHLFVLRGAAACAALVRAAGSYRGAADRAGDPVTVGFLRKWARVHDLPMAVRRHIATGDLAPSAAKHVARVTGDARFLLAWATLDHDLPVETVREVAGAVSDGAPVERSLRKRGVAPGELSVTLPVEDYVALRRRASLADATADEVVAAALSDWLADRR